MGWKFDLAKSVTVLLGIGALGAAMAFAISLAVLQNAAMAQNVWPTVYEPGRGEQLFLAGKQLQLYTNTSGGIGAVFLLVYGLMDHIEAETIDPEDYPWRSDDG